MMLILYTTTLIIVISDITAHHFPFSTVGRHIIDSTGQTLKFSCVNWPGSMETLMPEGLQHNSVNNIVLLIKAMGFNCVRLTFSIDMTLSKNQNITALESLQMQSLGSAVSGFQLYNPTLLDETVLSVFNIVLDALEQQDILILLDNHVSKAMWCCSDSDGNGFWNDKYFDPIEWENSLRLMSLIARQKHHIVAISLRNELRGSRQNLPDWYKYVLIGVIDTIHQTNPDILIVISGLNYDLDLSFIRYTPVQDLLPEPIKSKIVYEGHWYSWSNYGHSSECTKMQNGVEDAWGYITTENEKYTAPIWLTEFGTNVDNFVGDNYINCVSQYVQNKKISWAYWVLAGSYYIRDGTSEFRESFGLLSDDWQTVKSDLFMKILADMQKD
ncbi:unnamed protein product [Didymodactylos carnosus]|uniref:Glycoside hydrolase family 5 domain-containing protein n=2 Tax=Didymodactylos carnosus TaxID=1234261 RepID=A0A8S2E961_9BILA|nr:unnamed protein product [Didymodactylos carnosus]CAF3859366.1 unnamed protein product [Didymodactylos carnosus]